MQPFSTSVSAAAKYLFLRERHLRGHAAGGNQGALLGRPAGGVAMDVVLGDGLAHGRGVHGLGLAVDETGAVQFSQDGEDAARTVNVLDMVVRRGRHLADVGHLA
jgi:hypothetical protein